MFTTCLIVSTCYLGCIYSLPSPLLWLVLRLTELNWGAKLTFLSFSFLLLFIWLCFAFPSLEQIGFVFSFFFLSENLWFLICTWVFLVCLAGQCRTFFLSGELEKKDKAHINSTKCGGRVYLTGSVHEELKQQINETQLRRSSNFLLNIISFKLLQWQHLFIGTAGYLCVFVALVASLITVGSSSHCLWRMTKENKWPSLMPFGFRAILSTHIIYYYLASKLAIYLSIHLCI